MRKFGVCCSTIFLCSVIAGIYGILHDQLTYTLSPEYFTLYKFKLYHINPAEYGGDRVALAVIGFLASWWAGFFIGIGLSLTGLIFDDHREMNRFLPLSIVVVMITTFCMGLLGYLYGTFLLRADYILPRELADTSAFIVAGTVHNYSYVGALLGLLLGISFLFTQKAKANLNRAKFAV